MEPGATNSRDGYRVDICGGSKRAVGNGLVRTGRFRSVLEVGKRNFGTHAAIGPRLAEVVRLSDVYMVTAVICLLMGNLGFTTFEEIALADTPSGALHSDDLRLWTLSKVKRIGKRLDTVASHLLILFSVSLVGLEDTLHEARVADLPKWSRKCREWMGT